MVWDGIAWDGMAREKEAPILEEHPQREIFVVCCSSELLLGQTT